MTEGQVIKCVVIMSLSPGVGIETVAVAAKYMLSSSLYIYNIYKC